MSTSQDLRKKTFTRAMRGYSAEEVDRYIDFLCSSCEQLQRENAELENKVKAAVSKLEKKNANDDEVQRTLVIARQTAEQIVSDANSQASKILSIAKKQTDKILLDYKKKIENEIKIYTTMKSCVDELKISMLSQLHKNIVNIEKITSENVKTRTEESPRSTDTFVAQAIANMKNDISTPAPKPEPEILEITELVKERKKVRRNPQNTQSSQFKIESVKDTIKQINKEMLEGNK